MRPGVVHLRLSDNVDHVEVFEAKDLRSFQVGYRSAWQRWHLARPQRRLPALALHIWHRNNWWNVIEPVTHRETYTVDPFHVTKGEVAQYWKNVQAALDHFRWIDEASERTRREFEEAAKQPPKLRVIAGGKTGNPAFDMTLDDAYTFMDLPRSASADDVRAAYRRLVLVHHPDRGGDPVAMQKLNVARELIESGGPVAAGPEARPYSEDFWTARREAFWRPKPSRSYTAYDLRRVADWVLGLGLRQTLYRERVQFVPWDARVGTNEYTRPFGGVARRERIPEATTAETLASALGRYVTNGRIFDVGTGENVAWVTWEIYEPHGYVSISFEKPKKAEKKPKGVGMKPGDAEQAMRELGLREVAGGTKYGYWAEPNRTDKTGTFVRTAARTVRLVKRVRTGQGIVDSPISDEVYYGQLTRAQLQEWVQRMAA